MYVGKYICNSLISAHLARYSII